MIRFYSIACVVVAFFGVMAVVLDEVVLFYFFLASMLITVASCLLDVGDYIKKVYNIIKGK